MVSSPINVSHRQYWLIRIRGIHTWQIISAFREWLCGRSQSLPHTPHMNKFSLKFHTHCAPFSVTDAHNSAETAYKNACSICRVYIYKDVKRSNFVLVLQLYTPQNSNVMGSGISASSTTTTTNSHHHEWTLQHFSSVLVINFLSRSLPV